MAKGTNQKLKLSYLMKIMLEKTDDEHKLKMSQIMEELEKYEVTAERKSIYADFEDMREKLKIDVIKEQRGRETYYYIGSREFELPEVKILIDAIQSSRFITEKKSRELIKKIKGTVSEHQASTLQRQVYVQGRIKTMNESIYYNVDEIHNAIAENKSIQFIYYGWSPEKKLEPRHNGDIIEVSPWALTWTDENYYLIAYDHRAEIIKHYRVDKMMKIQVQEDERQGKKLFQDFDVPSYTQSRFGMYDGEVKSVHIEMDNGLCGVFIDRFGKDIPLNRISTDRVETIVDVAISPQFYGWILGLGAGVKITGPQEVVKSTKEYIEKALNLYQ